MVRRFLAAIVCLCMLLGTLPTGVAAKETTPAPETAPVISSLKPGDYTPEEICREITTTYAEARKYFGFNSFSGYCGTYVALETYLLGIDAKYTPSNGCDAFDKYCELSVSTGGYGITAYPAKQYTLREALAIISAEGPAYDILVGYQRGSSTADGQRYGHCVLINAIIDGTVYFSESFDFWIGNKKYKEGVALQCDLDYFCKTYEKFTQLDGVIDFTSPARLPAAGECGDNLKWYYGEGKLTISGTGDMYDGAPWGYLHRYVRSLIIEPGVTSIGSHAFAGFSRIDEVILPDSIGALGDGCFANCAHLNSVVVGKELTHTGTRNFMNCPELKTFYVHPDNPELKSVNGSLLRIRDDTLISCIACTSDVFTVPNGIAEIAADAFAGGSMTTIQLGKDLTYIAPGAFRDCTGLKSVKAAGGSNAFQVKNNQLRTGDGKSLLLVLGKNAWIGISSGVETVEAYAFSLCPKIQEVHLPGSVTYVDDKAFDGCSTMIRVSVENNNRSYKADNGILYTKDGQTLLQGQFYQGEEYKVLPTTVEIRGKAFFGCPKLTRVIVPDNVQIIGQQALGYDADGKIEGFTIVGGLDTPAHYYAKVNGFAFEANES